MQDNLLTWSVKNWITVFLMFLLGWAVVALAGRVFIGSRAKQSQTAAGVQVQ